MNSNGRELTTEEAELMRECAVGNITMLLEMALGRYRGKPGDAEERAAWLTEYVTTGYGLVTDEAEAMVRRVRSALQEEVAA